MEGVGEGFVGCAALEVTESGLVQGPGLLRWVVQPIQRVPIDRRTDYGWTEVLRVELASSWLSTSSGACENLHPRSS